MASLDKYIFFDFMTGDGATYEYSASEMCDAFRGLGDGIIYGIGNRMAVTSTGLVATVDTGAIMIQGHFGQIAAAKTVTHDAASAANTRFDWVVARLDIPNRIISLEIVKGTQSTGVPTVPALTQNASIYEVPLCLVKVTGGSTTLALNDRRPFILQSSHVAVPEATTTTLTFYVNASTGNDENDGLSAGNALKTIMAAINRIPQIINHTVIVNVANGTYAETVTITGFFGKGALTVQGNTTTPTNVNVVAGRFTNIHLSFLFQGFNATTTAAGFVFTNCVAFTCIKCNVTVANAAEVGIAAGSSAGGIGSCVTSNRNYGIIVSNGNVLSDNNSGTGNTIGIVAGNAGFLAKNGAQPATGEGTFGGGMIR